MNNQDKITKITIKNIRGFKEKTLDFGNGNEIWPNKINTLVAPNGYGKSSLYKAFECIGPKSFKADNDKFESKEKDFSSLSIELNKKEYIQCDKPSRTDISKHYEIICINQKVSPTTKNGGHYVSAKSKIDNLVIENVVERQQFKFEMESLNLDPNKTKVLPPQKFFKEQKKLLLSGIKVDLAYSLSGSEQDLRKITQKKYSSFFSSLTNFINDSSKTKANDIFNEIQRAFSDKLDQLEHLKNIYSVILEFDDNKHFGQILIICHILYLYKTTKNEEFTAWLKWRQYDGRKSKLKKLVCDINIGAFEAELKPKKGNLVIEYPEGSKLSNGEQDILVFVTHLHKALYYNDCKKPCILIIDEVFDYLDDFNIMIAKYYLNKIIEQFSEMEVKVYILVLSHLEPKDLQELGKLNRTTYLADKTHLDSTMEKIIKNRDNSDWGWKKEISKYFLHYDPECHDITQKFKDKGLKEELGENHKFYEFLEGEWNKLKSDNSYDPLAVCAYFRIEIEKRIYEKLAECKKEGFLTVHKTLKKIEYASENSVDIGDIWPLLAPIFNQALHADDVRKAQNIKRKLNNTIIKEVMKKAMDTEF